MYASAARAALSAAAFVEAEAQARYGLALAEAVSDNAQTATLLACLMLLGEAMIATRGEADDEVHSVHERGAMLAFERGHASEILPFLRGLTSFYMVRGPVWRAHQLGTHVLQIAGKIGEPMLLAQAERRHGWCQMCAGDLSGARTLFETALARQIAAFNEGVSDAGLGMAYDDANTLAHLAWFDGLGRPMRRRAGNSCSDRSKLVATPALHRVRGRDRRNVLQLAGDVEEQDTSQTRTGKIAAERRFNYWTSVADAVISWAGVVCDGSSDALAHLRAALANHQRTQGNILRPYLLAPRRS